MHVNFKFGPFEQVKIIADGLNYLGKIIRCEWDGQVKTYYCEYAADGKLEQRAFFEEQLTHEFL